MSIHLFFSTVSSFIILRLSELLAVTCRTTQDRIQSITESVRAPHLKNKRFNLLYFSIISIRFLSTKKSRLLLIAPSTDETIALLSASGNLFGSRYSSSICWFEEFSVSWFPSELFSAVSPKSILFWLSLIPTFSSTASAVLSRIISELSICHCSIFQVSPLFSCVISLLDSFSQLFFKSSDKSGTLTSSTGTSIIVPASLFSHIQLSSKFSGLLNICCQSSWFQILYWSTDEEGCCPFAISSNTSSLGLKVIDIQIKD